MNAPTPITEFDLHAYVDDELSPERRREVDAHLAINPEAAALIAQYRQINQGLYALYGKLPDDAGLTTPAPIERQRPRAGWRIATAAVWLGLGGLVGWQAQQWSTPPARSNDLLVTALSQPAAFAHTVYAAEVRHPVEVRANEQDHLIKWLSHRMQTPIQAPDLSSTGFALVGGRLLPSTDRMAGQFMYERGDGQRVTLYVRRGDWQNEQTAFRFAQQNGVTLFYWVDGPLGYALVSELDRSQLSPLAHAVYQQLHAQNPVQPDS